MAGVCISHSCLFLRIILSDDNWLASVNISKACLEAFGSKVLGCSKNLYEVTSELPEFTLAFALCNTLKSFPQL